MVSTGVYGLVSRLLGSTLLVDDITANSNLLSVAATGFFTDSYNLFASNIILPCLAFVYWGSEHEANIEITTNALTLAGSTIGQLIFGFLADKYGRQQLYGVELMIVIMSTIGLVIEALQTLSSLHS